MPHVSTSFRVVSSVLNEIWNISQNWKHFPDLKTTLPKLKILPVIETMPQNWEHLREMKNISYNWEHFQDQNHA